MPSLEVTITCRVFPTESEEKIVDTIKKYFGDVSVERKGDYIVAKGDESTVGKIINMIGRERIAARAYMLMKKRKRGNSIVIPFEREPLVVGKVSFGEDDEFPPIWIEIRGDVDEVLERVRDIADSG